MLAFAFAAILGPALLVAAQGNVSFVDPRKAGGSFLINANNGFGEPMNVSCSIVQGMIMLTHTRSRSSSLGPAAQASSQTQAS